MLPKQHLYQGSLLWTGNSGTGTSTYNSYERSFQWQSTDKPIIHGSSDPAFRGDSTKYNPEELLVASLSSCHMLWYLHLCAINNIIVVSYSDQATGWMQEQSYNGDQSQAGHFIRVLLRPRVQIQNNSQASLAIELHHETHKLCFIAASMNFPVDCEPSIENN